MQEELVQHLSRRDRGVKQANFYVLRATKMPAALAELVFISNPEEFSLISQESVKDECAKAIFDGIYEYYTVQ